MDLFDIIDKEKWQRMQSGFSKSLGICIRTVDTRGKPFPDINTPSEFCLDMAGQLDKKVRDLHLKCIFMLIAKIGRDRSENYRVCAFGGYIYGIPIEVQDEGTIAYVIVGPVLLQKKPDAGEYARIAKENKIDLEYLMDRLAGLKRFTFNGIESTMDLLYEVTRYIAQLNYETKKLRERFDMPRALDDVIEQIYTSACFDELLNALLDVSLNTTKGNTGSIMLLDKAKDELSVKFWRGIKDDVAKEARVKLGSSISGMVAKNGKPLLIDSSIKDAKIKNRLKRPYIRSSVVYPLEVKDRVFGVLNLNNTDVKTRFNTETLDLIGNLTRLTKIALGAFPKYNPV